MHSDDMQQVHFMNCASQLTVFLITTWQSCHTAIEFQMCVIVFSKLSTIIDGSLLYKSFVCQFGIKLIQIWSKFWLYVTTKMNMICPLKYVSEYFEIDVLNQCLDDSNLR